jgi:hypothetical protein
MSLLPGQFAISYVKLSEALVSNAIKLFSFRHAHNCDHSPLLACNIEWNTHIFMVEYLNYSTLENHPVLGARSAFVCSARHSVIVFVFYRCSETLIRYLNIQHKCERVEKSRLDHELKSSRARPMLKRAEQL